MRIPRSTAAPLSLSLSLALALALPMLVAASGCEGGAGSNAASVQETPQQAAERQKSIEEAYKTSPPDSAKKAGRAPRK